MKELFNNFGSNHLINLTVILTNNFNMETKNENNGLSRRKFLGASAVAAAGFTILPSSVIAGLGKRAPSDKLNIAVIGIGGMGNSNLKQVRSTENIVALCDTDWKYAKHVFDENPDAKRYTDFRKMYDEMAKNIDAVIVATADHTHAIVAAQAMEMGKHAFVQKPLTHTVYESRLLTKLAEKHKLLPKWVIREVLPMAFVKPVRGFGTAKLAMLPRWKHLPIDLFGHKACPALNKENGFPKQ